MVDLAMKEKLGLLFFVLLCIVCVGVSQTDRGDYAILDALRKGLDNPELLKWPSGDEDPCGSRWPHVFCQQNRVSQIQVAGLGLKGPLPQNFNQLTELSNVGLQRNSFTGMLPSLRGLSKLKFAYLGNNQFDTIPADFFVGLDSLQALSLENNPLNKSRGWMLPKDLVNSAQLSNLSLAQCNLVGPLPVFLGDLSSLTNLKLSYNRLTGELPGSLSNSVLQTLWLNNQESPGLTGPIDVIASIPSLTSVWLHGNSFTGVIPRGIAACTSLNQLWLNNNKLVGPIPGEVATMAQLQSLQVDNNLLTGPIPKLPNSNFTYAHNSFCQSSPGSPCPPETAALLDFLGGVNYPVDLSQSWSGSDPCSGNWIGVTCLNQKVSLINLPNRRLNGSISASLGQLDSLMDIRLGGNNISGTIPSNLTLLKSLRTLNLTSNNIAPPIPSFSSSVKLLLDDNPLLSASTAPSPGKSSPTSPSDNPSSSGGPVDSPASPNSPSQGGVSAPINNAGAPSKGSKVSKVVIVVAPIGIGLLVAFLVVFFVRRHRRRKNGRHVAASSIVIHPKDYSVHDNKVKVVVAENSGKVTGGSDANSAISSRTETHVIESGNLVISVQTLRNVTRNFDSGNELGRGGFGVVYKGVFDDGSTIAVKRMEAAVISSKALDEFQSEIAVLSKVRHRNLVSLLGYSVEGNEKLLVYEYMSQGALSKHLFQWQNLDLEPLSWKRRLNIALDVARGLEYLHNLAHQSFIHRDLKSSNILLDDDYRAKISDFGLVKLAPDGKNSVVTKLAGTFGYLAPEYAVTGKVTTKADVFSFGVVLMELVTGLIALDESRSEESQYLASWFCRLRSSKDTLMTTIDPSIEVTDETLESISIVSELAGHCAAREPQQRPDMGHAVNVLVPLVEKWKPVKDDQEEYLGIDLSQPLLQMVKGWQAADTSNVSTVSLDDSKGSIPARPAGFAESFTSSDGR